jgi:phage terminase large subunit-like protein
LASYHADILKHCFTPDEAGRLPYDVIGWCEPAKSGKSAIAGLVAQYMGLHGERNSMVIMASNKRDQAASIMYASFVESVKMNPALRIEPGRTETGLENGNTVKAIASNSRGAAGARFSLALFDELWGYIHLDAERLWTEFKTDPTRQNSVKLAVGYAGYLGEGQIWLDLLEGGLRGEPVAELAHITNGGHPACWRRGRTFVFWSHECRQPWQTDEWIAQQRRTLRPAEFARMINCEFAEGIGNFVDPEDWEALIDPEHRPLAPGMNVHSVFIGLDLALSAKGDDCALVGVYPDPEREGIVKLAFHRVWKGRERREQLKLSETVKPFLQRMGTQHHIEGIYFDPWQAQYLAEELTNDGFWCVPVHQTHASRGPLDTQLHDMVMNRQLVLYDHSDLRHLASQANAKELGNGLIFLQKAHGRAKIDLLIALSNCAGAAQERPAVAFL